MFIWTISDLIGAVVVLFIALLFATIYLQDRLAARRRKRP